jgi:hypothetical protein
VDGDGLRRVDAAADLVAFNSHIVTVSLPIITVSPTRLVK